MIPRARHLENLQGLLRRHRVVGLLGARQSGKTTLARQVAELASGPVHHFDLESPVDEARLSEPALALEPLTGLIVLDEIHHRPDLFPLLRVLADRRPLRARFLVLGSAAPDLLRQSSESLAGRIAYYELPPLRGDEVGEDALRRLWLRGGFPLAFRARTNQASLEWRRAFIRTFLGRDLATFGISTPSRVMNRLWSMLAHNHGQLLNRSQLANSLGVTHPTVGSYIDHLVGTYMVRELKPWFENLGKRQVKAPKLYVADSGLLHALLNIQDQRDLEGHPLIGASWEGFAMEEVLHELRVEPEDAWFWRTHQGAELDLLVMRGRKRFGFEFKRSANPKMSRSMHTALDSLRLDRLLVVHAGTASYPLTPKTTAVPLWDLRAHLP